MAIAVFPCGDDVKFIYRGLEVTYGTIERGGLCWMDRNLGASQVATSSTDEDAYGDLFQWGRLDDGHQVRDPLSGTTTDLSITDVPPHGNFILAPDEPRDWRVGQNNNLWQGVNGINNPCPTGWRVPTETEWAAERASWGFNLNSTTEAINSSLKLPAVGFRDFGDGVLINSGTHGYYWSSTVAVNDPRSMYLFISPNVGSSMSHGYRASGLSVRCVKDN